MKLPSNPLFAPTLNLTVRDTRLGGLLKPIIATASVPLSSKIPGSRDYKPPCGAPTSETPFARRTKVTQCCARAM